MSNMSDFAERTMRALGRAHFKSVQDELATETLTFYEPLEDFEPEELWTFKDLLECDESEGWVN